VSDPIRGVPTNEALLEGALVRLTALADRLRPSSCDHSASETVSGLVVCKRCGISLAPASHPPSAVVDGLEGRPCACAADTQHVRRGPLTGGRWVCMVCRQEVEGPAPGPGIHQLAWEICERLGESRPFPRLRLGGVPGRPRPCLEWSCSRGRLTVDVVAEGGLVLWVWSPVDGAGDGSAGRWALDEPVPRRVVELLAGALS
jgi:hypothetical protein